MASHKLVYERIIKYWPQLLEFLEDIIFRQSQSFSETTQENANSILHFMRDKFALALLHLYLDILDTLTTESKIFQKSGSTIIRQGESKHRLKLAVDQLKSLKGFHLQRFLLSCSCYKTIEEAQKFMDGKLPM